MNEYDITSPDVSDFATDMVLVWGGLILVAFVTYAYVWPFLVRAYWATAYVVYWAMRKCIKTTRGHERSLYTGYTYNNKENN